MNRHANNITAVISAALLCLATVSTVSAGFLIKPFIQRVTMNSVTVCWETAVPQPGAVRYGKGSGKYTHKADAGSSARQAVKVAGLEPGTLYYYRVISGDDSTPDGDRSYYFTTAHEPGDSFVFAAYGDTRNGINSFDIDHEMVIDSVVRYTAPQFCLITGDLVDRGSDRSLWENFFRIESPLLRNCAACPVYGYNDAAEVDSFKDYFLLDNGGRWYSFDWGGCHFTGLYAWDAYRQDYSPSGRQYLWLEKDLREAVKRKVYFTVVFLNESVYFKNRPYNKQIAKHWVPLFSKYGVDIVFTSGEHLYEHSGADGVRYIITGGGGAELSGLSLDSGEYDWHVNFHHCRVSVNPPLMEVEAVDVSGNVFDSFSVTSDTYEPGVENLYSPAVPVKHKAAVRKEYIKGVSGGGSRVLDLSFFSVLNCRYCTELKERILPRLAGEHGVNIRIDFYPLEEEGNFDKLNEMEKEYGDMENEFPVIFTGGKVFGGEEEIKSGLELLFAGEPEKE